MANSYKNFSDDTLGTGLPTGWTEQQAGATPPTYEIIEDATSLFDGGKVFKITAPATGSTQRNVITLDAYNGTSHYQTILFRFKFDAVPSGCEFGCFYDYSYSTGDAGYLMSITGSSLAAWEGDGSGGYSNKVTESPAPTFSTGVWYTGLIVQYDASNHLMKYWDEDGNETISWHMAFADATHSAGGTIGFAFNVFSGAVDDLEVRIDCLNLGTDNDRPGYYPTFPRSGLLYCDRQADYVFYMDVNKGSESFGLYDGPGGADAFECDVHKGNEELIINDGTGASDDIQITDFETPNTSLAIAVENVGTSAAVAINEADGYLFYGSGSNVGRVDYGTWANGATPSTGLSGGLNSMYYDATNENLYVGTSTNLYRCDADGSNATSIHTGTVTSIRGNADYLLIVSDGDIVRKAIDGGTETTIINDGDIQSAEWIPTLSEVWFVDTGGDLAKCDIDGNSRTAVSSFSDFGASSTGNLRYYDFDASVLSGNFKNFAALRNSFKISI